MWVHVCLILCRPPNTVPCPMFTVIDSARFACQLLFSPYRLLALLAAFFSRSARTSDTGKVYLIRIYMAFLVTFAILVRSSSLHACLFPTTWTRQLLPASDGSALGLLAHRPNSAAVLSTTVAPIHLFPHVVFVQLIASLHAVYSFIVPFIFRMNHIDQTNWTLRFQRSPCS